MEGAFRTPQALMMLPALAGASPCASKTAVRPLLPPVADHRRIAEPEYPVAVHKPGNAGVKAEATWRDNVLIWDRTGWAQDWRACQLAVDMQLGPPAGYCTP